MTTFKNGDTVYLIDGQEAEYVAASDGDHIVRAIYDYEDREPHYDKPHTVREVFATPPTARYDERIGKLQADVEALEARAKAARVASQAFEREESARRERIRLHGQLELIDNLLSGKITHVVERSYGSVKVTSIADAVKGEYTYSDLVGLNLKASRDGKSVRWTIGDTGRWAIPCTSLEAAREVATKAIEQEFEGHRKSGGYSEDLLRLYANLGNTPPADLAERAHLAKIATYKSCVEKGEKDLATYRERLAALQSEASA